MMDLARQSGFTPIEWLIVMSMMAVLAGMLMPMITSAQGAAERTGTQNMPRKANRAQGGSNADNSAVAADWHVAYLLIAMVFTFQAEGAYPAPAARLSSSRVSAS